MTQSPSCLETCIAVCCEPGLEINIAALAVLKAGCVYVPVNHNEAPERISHILDDTAPPLALTTSGYANLLAGHPTLHILMLDRYVWCDTASIKPESTVPPDTLACITYTSGTTGKPKGIMAPHRGMVSRIQDSLSRFPTLNNDVFIQRMPHGFDFSIWEMFWFMATPYPAVIAPQESRYDPELLYHLMEQTCCHHYYGGPFIL